MDERFSAVLETYHARIEEERRAYGPAGRLDRGRDRDQLLLAVGPQTGQLINILAKSLEAPHILELGTSFGYSTLWLAEAARATGGRVTTMQLHPGKSAHAREKVAEAGLAEHVDFQVGDALKLIEALPGRIDFVLVDLWKDLYLPCLERFAPKLNRGAILVADNIIRPGGEGVLAYLRAVRAMPKMRSLMLPVGSGLEISRFEGGPG